MKLSLFSRSLFSFVVFASAAIWAVAIDIGRAVARVLDIAFPAAAAIEGDSGLPRLISTETFRQGVDSARADSFTARRAARTFTGRGSGDPCAGLAFAA